MTAQKTALITGTSSGFGLDMTQAFLKKGYKVYATLRRAEERKELFEELKSKFGEALQIHELDVTKPEDRVKTAEIFQNQNLDLLINNAGYGLLGAFENTDEAEFKAQFETNFFGAMYLTQALLPALRKTQGRIINISSVVGYQTMPLMSAYCASKHALEGWAEALYYELSPSGVQVCLVEPGGFNTGFGQNVAWAKREDHPLALEASSAHFKKFKEDLNFKKSMPAQKVTDLVVRLAHKKRMPLRARMGHDASAAYYLKKLLPQRVHTWLLGKIFKKTHGL